MYTSCVHKKAWIAFMLCCCSWQEEKFLVMEKGTEVEVGQTIVVLELEEEENGYTKRVFQISNSLIATGHSVSFLLFTPMKWWSIYCICACT